MQKLFPDDIITETGHFSVNQDWEVPIVGFFIIGAKDPSKRSFMDFSTNELHEFAELLGRVRTGMKKVLGITDVYVFQNEDTVHGFHVWLFPRHEWMKEFGQKIQSVRPIMEHAVKTRGQEPYLSEVHDAARLVRDNLN